MIGQSTAPLPAAEWRARAAAHRDRAEAWTRPFRQRRSRGEVHPVYDFLFIYYQFPPSQLEIWHPGPDLPLVADTRPAAYNPKFYSLTNDTLFLDSEKLDARARRRLEGCRELCRAVAGRPAQFGCFGLHEWAMVYRGGPEGRPRHEGTLPLRLPQAAIDAVVESRPICCSHFDAFRFFTGSAMPLNKLRPDPASRLELEQSGCLHTNMDLYKCAARCMPWVGSNLLWDTFEYAVRCRIIDMRASPYDCGALGYAPIPIETADGRAEYEREQRALAEAATPLRRRLIDALDALI